MHALREGLTCECHAQELIAAGQDAVHAIVERIIAEAHAAGNAAGSNVSTTHGAASNAEEGLHNLAPLGARVSADAATIHRTGTLQTKRCLSMKLGRLLCGACLLVTLMSRDLP